MQGITTLSGGASIDKGLTVTGGTNTDSLGVSGASTLNTLTTTGAANFQGTFAVEGATTLNGATTINNELTVKGNQTVGGNSAISGNQTIGGRLQVTGASTFTGGATVNQGLAVTGGTSTDALNVSGATKLNSLNVSGDSRLQGNLAVQGSTTLNGAATINGATTINDELTVSSLRGSGTELIGAGSDGTLKRSSVSMGQMETAVNKTIPKLESAARGLGRAVESSGAIAAAMSAIPEVTLQEDEPMRCGVGTGGFGSQYAVSAGCAVRVGDRLHLNGALSYSPSVDYDYGNTPSVAGRLGFSFPLGPVSYTHLTLPTTPYV